MLNSYLAQTGQLLQNPGASTALYSTSDLTGYINRARSQLAAETECIRLMNTLTLTFGTQVYSFSSISPATTGTAGVYNVRGATCSVASGFVWLSPRPFPWFQLYYLNNPVPQTGFPTTYAQFGQGVNGSLYFNPVPDFPYTVMLDCVCEPIALASDADPEDIPYPFTEAVPYYAAYLALLSAQRMADAQAMWQEYQKFAARGRQLSNGAVNPAQYPQQPNPVRPGQLGMAQGGAAGG